MGSPDGHEPPSGEPSKCQNVSKQYDVKKPLFLKSHDLASFERLIQNTRFIEILKLPDVCHYIKQSA